MAAIRVLSGLLILVLGFCENASGNENDFTPLFNGRDLSGWHGWDIHGKGGSPGDVAKMNPEEKFQAIETWTADAKKHWTVQNGELVNDGHGTYLATEKEFGDIELLIEYKTVPKADSGIYLRNTPQVQIWDSNQVFDPKNPTRRPHLGSGGLFNNNPDSPGRDPRVLADKPFGQWNQFRIVQVGERTSIWFNGQKVVDHARLENYWKRELPIPAKGKIILQTHGGEIRWRNIAVREIPPAEANTILRSAQTAGFESIFSGKDFTGWDGPTDQYEIINDAIVCKKGKGGNIYTKDQFADYTVRLEYKLPPGGNNGLAIRTPGGKAHVATEAMCEVQILDDTAKQYEKLDPRQYNGSVYGMIPAHRGYLRPVGEWNLMEVTVIGPKIRIELNGTRIVDGDVSTIKEFKDNQKHPGKDRPSGHFGFAGHNDPVAFRNIEVRKIEKLWGEGEFTEGPAEGPDGCIYFSDIGNRIMKFDPSTGKTVEFRKPSGRSNGLKFDAMGRLIAAEGANAGGNRRISRTEKDGTITTVADKFMGKRFNSPNDLTLDSKGRIYFSDPRYVGDEPIELDRQSVYRIDPNSTVTEVIQDVKKPNGLVISPDGKTLYLAESDPKGEKKLFAYPLNADGSVGARKDLYDFGTGRGIDGMTVNTEGIIIATAGAKEAAGIYFFSPEGKKLDFLPTPEDPSNCCLAGANKKTLYITAGKSLYRVKLK